MEEGASQGASFLLPSLFVFFSIYPLILMLLPCTTPFHTSHIAKLILNANKKAFLPCSPFWASRNPPPYSGPKNKLLAC